MINKKLKILRLTTLLSVLFGVTIWGDVIPAPSPFFSISPGVTLTPQTVPTLDPNTITGPLNGVQYPLQDAFGLSGGTGPWVQSSFSVPENGPAINARLFFMVSDVFDTSLDSALAIDNIRVGSTVFEGFEDTTSLDSWNLGNGAPIPAGGRIITHPEGPNIIPTEGGSFAIMDTDGQTGTGGVLDTRVFGFGAVHGTTLLSDPFTLNPGENISLDLRFLTQDDFSQDFAFVQLFGATGDPFQGAPSIATLFTAQVVPEPTTYLLFLCITLAMLFCKRLARRKLPAQQ